MPLSPNSVVAVATSVLLVDDDVAVLALTQRILERAGYCVVPCNSGDAALAALAAQSFDVMVSDIHMPGLTGLRLLRAIRDHDLDLPVVLVTGDPEIHSAAEAVEYGAFRYLIKPVPIEELRAVVARAGAVGRLARSNASM